MVLPEPTSVEVIVLAEPNGRGRGRVGEDAGRELSNILLLLERQVAERAARGAVGVDDGFTGADTGRYVRLRPFSHLRRSTNPPDADVTVVRIISEHPFCTIAGRGVRSPECIREANSSVAGTSGSVRGGTGLPVNLKRACLTIESER